MVLCMTLNLFPRSLLFFYIAGNPTSAGALGFGCLGVCFFFFFFFSAHFGFQC